MHTPATRARSSSKQRRRSACVIGYLLLALCSLKSLSGCKSQAEKCDAARTNAEQAWRIYVTALASARAAALATQADTKSKLTGQVEARLSDASARAASQRYDRGTDAWQRAYQANQSAACAGDSECAQLKQANANAIEQTDDLMHKLPLARAGLAALRGDAEAIKRAAAAVTPEQGNAPLQKAKLASDAAYRACKDLPSSSR